MKDRCFKGTSAVDIAGLFEPDVVHQATGMVIEQLNVGAADALARMRRYAAHRNQPLDEIAQAVIERDLRFYV